MDRFFLFYIFVLLWLIPFSFGDTDNNGVCMKSKLHKSKPGPESELFSQCTPWKNRSCCTNSTATFLHDADRYHFNINHCKPVSQECRKHFVQDLCFYECSPNLGNWLVEVEMKTRSQRFYQAPLCRRDCFDWFYACRHDFTCSSNWLFGWKWINGTNVCKKVSSCLTIETVFGTAENFCEQVWDGSWKVTPDHKPCFTLWFNGTEKNPNDEVAQFYSMISTSGSRSVRISILYSFVLLGFGKWFIV